MAIDEAIFREAQRTAKIPTLRFYGWSKPSVSIGHFQNRANEIDLTVCQNEGIDIVCRPTGGKAVYHDDDLTYAVIAGEKNSSFPPDILGTYRVISQCMISGLRHLGIEAELAERHHGNNPEQLKASCFAVPANYELLVNRKKICGSAQVRSRGTFLQHGSLLITFDPVKTYEMMLPHAEPRSYHLRRLRDAVTSLQDYLPVSTPDSLREICFVLKQAFARHFDVILKDGELTPEEEKMKIRLLHSKYRQDRCMQETK